MLNPNIDELRTRIELLEAQLQELKQQLSEAGQDAGHVVQEPFVAPTAAPTEHAEGVTTSKIGHSRKWPLEAEEYIRYGRQMIMPEIGLQGGNHAALRMHTESAQC